MHSRKPLHIDEIPDAILEAHIALAEAAAHRLTGDEGIEWSFAHSKLHTELQRRHWERRCAERAKLEAMQRQLFAAASVVVATTTGEEQ